MNVLRAMDRSAFQFDFALHSLADSSFVPEARDLGAKIFLLNPPRHRPFSYGKNFTRLLRDSGPFDVVHSHVHLFSGYALRIAARSGVVKRIAHSHTIDEVAYANASVPRRAYYGLMRRWILRYSTAGLACSPVAAAALYGTNWPADPRWQVLPYGLDLSRFSSLPAKSDLRAQIGIPRQRVVIGQVSRLVDFKNQAFAVKVLACLVKRGIDAHLLLVGGGPMESALRAQLQELGLTERATLAGDQSDVAPFVGAMDCFVFPSEYEGLGIVALESQAAGVPVIASDQVPEQAVVVPGMVERIPLARGPEVWADTVMRYVDHPAWNPRETAKILADSEFGIGRCLERLYIIYGS
jgi:glycosyltransferase involved in cell wall biosynthesis